MPAGGTAAALCGAMSAALISKMARLTLENNEDVGVQREMQELLERSERLRARFQHLVQEDVVAYERLAACYKLPRNGEDGIARARAIQAQLIEATLTPLDIVETAARLIEFSEQLARIADIRLPGVISVATGLAASAGMAAGGLVRANLASLKDPETARIFSARLTTALNTIAQVNIKSV